MSVWSKYPQFWSGHPSFRKLLEAWLICFSLLQMGTGQGLALQGHWEDCVTESLLCIHVLGMVPSSSRKNTWSREVPEIPQRESENCTYPAEHLWCHGWLVPLRFQFLGSRDGCSIGAQTYEPSAFLGPDRIFPFSALLATWYFVGMCLFSLAMFWENCLYTWSGTLRRIFPS